MTIPDVYVRVACFSSIDYFNKLGEEWLRDDQASQPTLTEMVNGFLDETGVAPVSVSAPQVTVLSRTETRQSHRSTVSLLYRPKEIVVNGESSEAPKGLKEATEALAQQIREYVNAPGTR